MLVNVEACDYATSLRLAAHPPARCWRYNARALARRAAVLVKDLPPMQLLYTILTMLLVVSGTRISAQFIPLPLPILQILICLLYTSPSPRDS